MGANSSDDACWWYEIEDETKGPVAEAELRRLLAAGELLPQSVVWREDFGEDWRTLEDCGLVAPPALQNAPGVSDGWHKVFARIEAAEAPQDGLWGKLRNQRYPFSLLGFLFGPLYYLYLRMWNKALLIFTLGCATGIFESVTHVVYANAPTKILNIVPMAICGSCVKHDYYMFRVHGEIVWPWKPLKAFRTTYAALALAIGAFVALLLVPGAATADRDLLAEVSGSGGQKLGRENRPVRTQAESSFTLPSGATVSRHGNVITMGAPPAPTRAAANDAGISGSYCSTGKLILESQTLQFRERSIPVDTALDAFVNEDNLDYQQFMMTSVRELYRNPEGMRERLNDGGWMQACIRAVRGY